MFIYCKHTGTGSLNKKKEEKSNYLFGSVSVIADSSVCENFVEDELPSNETAPREARPAV